MVTRIEPGAVWVGDERIPAPVVLWAAGVAASPLGRKLGVPVDRAGRVLVQPDLSIPGHPEVFVIGDLAALKDENGKMLPGVAQVAIQQGDWVAETIARDLENQPRRNFHYHDKGSLATIGRAAAVAQFGKFELSGYFAWLAWLFIHILFLIGFRNRLLVMIQWAWSYLTYERGARLITGSDELPGWTEAQPERRPRQSPMNATPYPSASTTSPRSDAHVLRASRYNQLVVKRAAVFVFVASLLLCPSLRAQDPPPATGSATAIGQPCRPDHGRDSLRECFSDPGSGMAGRIFPRSLPRATQFSGSVRRQP